MATWNVAFQTGAWLCFGALFISMGHPAAAAAMFGVGALVAAFFGWMAWLTWRALKMGWGCVHSRLDGSDVLLENPFNFAFGKKKRFPHGDTVKLSVKNRMKMGKPQSAWTMSGTRTTVVFYAAGAWTEARWYELGAGLQRLGFTIVTEPNSD